MNLEERALQLIEKIYAGVSDPDRWQEFVEAFSEALDGSAVGFGLNHPSDPLAGTTYLHGMEESYRRSFAEHLIAGLPFAAHFGEQASKRFMDLGELFPEIELLESDFYRNWMAPQGFAPEWPIGCSLWLEGGGPVGWTYAWRPLGKGPFEARDLALADLLLPHLRRALELRLALSSSRHERRALGEVMDRLPNGVVLLDAERRVVSKNLSAARILALDDGLSVGPKGPKAAARRDHDALERLLASAYDPDSGQETQAGGFIAITRPSGKRSFVVMVVPLLAAPPGSSAGDAVVALFVADPEAGRVSATQVLETIYQLTHAEADLVRLLAAGYSLERAAEKRGVTINTARGQLKQVFAKTDTKRQGELVRLVLTGVGTLRER